MYLSSCCTGLYSLVTTGIDCKLLYILLHYTVHSWCILTCIVKLFSLFHFTQGGGGEKHECEINDSPVNAVLFVNNLHQLCCFV